MPVAHTLPNISSYRYKAFICYSDADDKMASALQRALVRYGRHWYQRDAFAITHEREVESEYSTTQLDSSRVAFVARQ
jgi:hypothetical protein